MLDRKRLLDLLECIVVSGELTTRMSHDEERVNSGQIRDKRDRASRHWLSPLVGLFGVCSVCPLSQPHHYISKSGAAKAKAIRRSRVGAKPRLCHETPQIRMIDMICGKIYLMHD